MSAPEKAETAEEAKEDVERIRDIIFGGQMREYEARFQMMEQSLRSEADAVKRELDVKKAELERHMNEVREQIRAEVAQAREELAGEIAERRRGLAELTAQTKEGFLNVEVALKSSDGRLSDTERKFQEGLIEKTQFIHEEVQASVKNLTNYLDVQTRELREGKLDRDDLSKALQFVAGGLAPKKAEQAVKAAKTGSFPV